MNLQYKNKFNYEVNKKPFQGSKKEARRVLEKYPIEPSSIDNFLEFLDNDYCKFIDKITFIKFYNFVFYNKDKHFPYHIAMIYTQPDVEIRDVLFDERENIASKTGWYPYITGVRANIKSLRTQQIRKTKKRYIRKCTFGRPISISNISSDMSSSAILLKCENGNILFDTGFGINMSYIREIDIICISHYHKDHTGGLIEILKSRQIPVLISSITLEYLLNTSSGTNRDLIIRNAILLEDIENFNNFRRHLDFYQVYHVPGSVGFLYKYNKEFSIFYFGDVCLSNGFYSFKGSFLEIIKSNISRNTHVILDCAMIGKKDIVIAEDSIEDIMNEIQNSVSKRNIFFISKSDETLIYTYIQIFRYFIGGNKNIKYVINNDLYNILKILWKPWVSYGGKKDLFIVNVMKKGLVNFVESYKLYPFLELDQLRNKKDVIYILTLNDLNEIKDNTLIKNNDVILVGPWVIKEDIPNEISDSKPRSILRVASPDWSFHTSIGEIEEIIKELMKIDIHVELFHNYPGNLRRFLKKIDLSDDINVVSSTEIII